jgi:hypothetical protein
MRYLLKNKNLALLTIAAFLVGGFFVFAGNVKAITAPTGSVTNEAELITAINTSSISEITIENDFSVTSKIVISRPLTINGANHAISFSSNTANHWDGDYVFQVYNTSDVIIKDIKINGGDAALLVNQSNAKLEGTIDVSNNEFGGIESSNGSVLNVLSVSLVNSSEAYGLPTIWEDGLTGNTVTGFSGTTATITRRPSQIQYYLVADNATTIFISNDAELAYAINNQADGQIWQIKNGTYNTPRFSAITAGGQIDWYFPITKNNISIIGESKAGVILASDVVAPNGNWSSQDYISVWGDGVSLENLTLKSKTETNKTIEVMGKNFTIKNVDFVKNDNEPDNFAGSLYFNPQNPEKNIGSAFVQDVLINDAWISAGTSSVTSGELVLKDVTIDFRGSTYASIAGYGVISKNVGIIKIATDGYFKVLIDDAQRNIQSLVIDRVPSGSIVELDAGTYNESILVDKALSLTGKGSGNTIITGLNSTQNYIVKVDGTSDVALDGIGVDGGGIKAGDNNFTYGILINNSGSVDHPVTISNSAVKNIWQNGSNGIEVDSHSYALIHDSAISSFHKRGVRFLNSSGKVYGNEIIGDDVDGTNRVQNLVNLWGGADVEIYDNKLHNAVTSGGVPTWSSPAIFVSSYDGGTNLNPSTANIHDNQIYNNDTGVVVGSYYVSGVDGSTATITNNTFHDVNNAINLEKGDVTVALHNNSFGVNIIKAINSDDGYGGPDPKTSVDATKNYWGTVSSTEIAALVYDGVTYTPWYTDETMTVLSDGSNNSITTTADDNQTVSSNGVTVTSAIPSGTTVTGNSSWDGTISAPTATTKTVTISGYNTTVTSAIAIGSSDSDLTFDKAVKLTFSNQAGKHVGWYNQANVFTEITDICDLDANTTTINGGNPFIDGGSCKMDVGSDLVVYTKHFSTFVTYTQTKISNGGGGGSASNTCSAITYGEYGACINGTQFRDVLTQSPGYCTLSTKQQLDRSRPCAISATPAVPGVEPATPATPAKPITKKVLGVQQYAIGTLLRSNLNHRIYVVTGETTIKHVANLKELLKYIGHTTLSVDDSVIAAYSQVLGAEKYADGTLVRSRGDHKVYVIINGEKVHIKTLKELFKYLGKPILEIE